MLADEHDLNDVAIHWPDPTRGIAAIRRSGRCPSFGVPRKLRVPGGLVALVTTAGKVILLFRVASVEEGVPVTAADGKHYPRGCVLVARPGTVRTPGPSGPTVLSVNRHAPGAFAYFDATSYQRVIYEPGGGETEPRNGALKHTPFPARRYPLFANNIGKTLSQPERELILAYATWVGDVTMFIHHPLKETGLYTDLFIPRCWTLFEAKASVVRKVIREAIGQLFDYQRHYDRSPRLAILLPQQPPTNLLGLFEKKRIAVVWRSRGGSFRNSANGTFTKQLRAVARSRMNGILEGKRDIKYSVARIRRHT